MAITDAQIIISTMLPKIATLLDDIILDQTGVKMAFALLVFNEEENGHTSYVANCSRPEVVKAMKEFIARQNEPGLDDPLHEKVKLQ